MKSEPHVYSFEDLKNAPRQRTLWEGVRNYQARNFMRDEMSVGDKVFFYHSSCPVPGIAGVAEISRTAEPDLTALDPESEYYDPKATKENPRWYQVEVKYVKTFPNFVSLADLRGEKHLSDFRLLQKGNRLSILPVTPAEAKLIEKMGG
jgi:predicted RNA-binding protein with PUA-like domain